MAALGDDLLSTVNKLQDLVFNTIGNDSLDLPQIVRFRPQPPLELAQANQHSIGRCRFSVCRKVVRTREHCWP